MVTLAQASAMIEVGDVIACRGASAIDWLIDHVTGSDYCHVALVIATGGEISVLQAMATARVPGVAIAPISSLLQFDKCDWLAAGVNWMPVLDHYAKSFVGRPYSELAALGAGLGLPMNTHQEICSVLVAQILLKAGIKMPTSGVTPGRCVDALLDANAPLRRLSG